MAIGKMHPDTARLRVDSPDFLGAMSEIELHFEIQQRGGVGVGHDFDGERGGAFKVPTRSRTPKLGSSQEADVRWHPRIFRELKARFDTHIAKPMLIDIGLQEA